MRNLTIKQKRLIIAYIDSTCINHFDVDQCGSLYDELEKINDTEILYQESNRFGQDYIWSDSHDTNGRTKFKKQHLHKNLKVK